MVRTGSPAYTRSSASTITGASNLAFANSPPASPIARRIAPSASNKSTARAIFSLSNGCTTKPVYPSTTPSPLPSTPYVTTGFPASAACGSARASPSRRDG